MSRNKWRIYKLRSKNLPPDARRWVVIRPNCVLANIGRTYTHEGAVRLLENYLRGRDA